MPAVRIFHNPACSTSRRVLDRIRETGVEPEVVLYLKTPPTRAALEALLAKMGVGPRAILRKKGTPYEELGLDDPAKTDAELIDAILAHPILIERPIVATAKGARICRPIESVDELL
jgi:arsenate reductase (glutaredoxin)